MSRHLTLLLVLCIMVPYAGTPISAQGLKNKNLSTRQFEELLPNANLKLKPVTSFEKQLAKLGENSKGSLPARLTLTTIQANALGLSSPFSNSNERIVGGVEAATNELPWQVALVLARYPTRQGQFCGGSLISTNYVLTAAHCVDDMKSAQLYVFAGSIDLAAAGQNAQVESITLHPGWNSNNMQNDIALIKLASSFPTDNAGILPIELANAGSTIAGGLLFTVSGWGAVKENGNGSRILKKVIVPTVVLEACNADNFYSSGVLSGMFCAGIGGKDSCQGDSGGPIVESASANPIQVGVVSWGNGCARTNKPGVYTDVAFFRQWIKDVSGI